MLFFPAPLSRAAIGREHGEAQRNPHRQPVCHLHIVMRRSSARPVRRHEKPHHGKTTRGALRGGTRRASRALLRGFTTAAGNGL